MDADSGKFYRHLSYIFHINLILDVRPGGHCQNYTLWISLAYHGLSNVHFVRTIAGTWPFIPPHSQNQFASQILASPDPSPRVADNTNATDFPPPRLRTQVGIQAEKALADEKDRLAAAEEFQRYITEGILDEAELKDFSLTWYWHVS